MSPNEIDAVTDRIVVIAPSGRDALLICGTFDGIGVDAVEVKGLGELAEALRAGTVGTAIVVEECLGSPKFAELVRAVQEQPPWSDLPFVVLTRRGGLPAPLAHRAEMLGNVTILERPFHPTTLVGAVRATLRSRGRQRSAEALLAERAVAEAELRRLNEELGDRVVQRTVEREAAVAQLLEARKLETLGQLTGGVAHDFNNLLTPIMGALDILGQKVTDDARALRLVNGAMQSAERARTLVARLLAFGRRQTLQARPVELVVLLEGMRELIERSLGPTIGCTFDVAPSLSPVLVDPHQLELSLLNLAVNARDAMPSGGALTIRAAPDDGEGLCLGGPLILLTVTDTGVGMDEATLARAVEPFFTTKEVGQGTGLGLSMVHGLAGQSGGAFRLSSEVGRGTVASLWLPVATEAPETIPASGAEPAVPPTVGKVLLVDDEELVRMSVAGSLIELGFDVVEAASASAALVKLREGLRPDVLVTDHLMPGMTGATLAREARLALPELPVLLITGYANLREEESRGLEVLGKPFRQHDLAARVSTLMGKPGGSSAACLVQSSTMV